ncbi:iron ABC transporter permease [Ureaplasma zalophigenitalium]|uniref:Iron ABC transporter permease n=1 Tax=Ureaplasma zalophigenitalium TaxID=907723 RepID=A0ABT3BNG4_9BACT|nr:iron ABC transporter permease [Ureaplasma zalophigenitalium]MCV3753784.1 iron ABC transporter permease [Ureaplasma zalophigenitalium]
MSTLDFTQTDEYKFKKRWNRAWGFKNPLKAINRKSYIKTAVNVFVMCTMFLIVFFWNQGWKVDPKEVIRHVMVGKLLLTGICMGLSGYLIQTLTNNRFSDTSILGIGNINLLGLMIFVQMIGFQTVSMEKFNFVIAFQPFLYFVSPLILMIIYYVASKEVSSFNFKKMIIAGILVNFLSTSIALIVSQHLHELGRILISNLSFGTVGVGGGDFMKTFYISLGLIIFGIFIVAILSNKIKIIVANQQIASQLGIKVNLVSLATLIAICLMVGASYSLNGNLVFVGLVAGNIARNINKHNYKTGMITSSSLGATFYMAAFGFLFLIINIPEQWVNLAVPLLISPYFIILISKKE